MIIRSIGFNPLRVEVDGIEVPVSKTDYVDEKGNSKSLHYVMVNGEKFPMEYQESLVEEFLGNKVDTVLEKIEIARIEKKPLKEVKPQGKL